MSPALASATALAAMLLAWGVLLAAAPAWAEDISLVVKPGFSFVNSDSVDETGRATNHRILLYQQHTRLNLDRSLFPLLRLTGNGYYDFGAGVASDDGVERQYQPQTWGVHGQLTWSIPLLNASVAYDRRQGFTNIQSALGRFTATAPVVESFSGRVAWRPLDLPTVDLTVARNNQFDVSRQLQNQSVDTAALAFSYRPERRFELTERLAWTHPTDHLRQVESSDLTNAFSASWGDRFWGDRIVTYAAYNLATRSSSIMRASAGATLERMRHPIAGISVVEVFPLVATRVRLNGNPALIDGNLNVGAGVHLGYGLSEQNDVVPRAVGGQFNLGDGAINRVAVAVDKELPPDAVASFHWEAWRSEDNLNWQIVPLAGEVVFNYFTNRFEIPIALTMTTFLKVVTRPLPVGVTSDERYREIQVTEVQFFELVPVDAGQQAETQISGNLNASARVQLFRLPSLSYDFSFFLSHHNAPARVPWSMVNGLSFNHRLARVFTLSARADRADSHDGREYTGLTRWSASMTADPLPTFRASLSYSGQVSQRTAGVGVTQSVGLFARAELYRGLSTFANANYSFGLSETGQSSQNITASASVAVVPLKFASLNAGFNFSDARATGGGLSPVDEQRFSLEANATLSPFRALALSGGVSRQWRSQGPPATLANFSGAVSPFPQGDLQVRYAYSETLNTAGDVHTRSHGPSLRWNIRRGWQFDAGFNQFQSSSPTVRANSYTVSANLVATLR